MTLGAKREVLFVVVVMVLIVDLKAYFGTTRLHSRTVIKYTIRVIREVSILILKSVGNLVISRLTSITYLQWVTESVTARCKI